MEIVDSTQQLLEAAMRGSWQRQTALTNNVANAETPGYRRQDVDFESALQSAVGNSEAPLSVQFQTQQDPIETGPNGEGVSVDQEASQLAENGLDYEALTEVVGARNTIIRSAIGIS
ncbi:MAG TPA: flagellar basal body protein [Solirubrobacteraceae bacterium]|nr:flagellar basal body protein [Solirubrobacteraceae bacterium]